MRQKMSLAAAGRLLGISANAVRARAKKSPGKYAVERDNRGKIWVYIDPETLQVLKPSKGDFVGSTIDELKVSIDALRLQADLAAEAADLREKLAASKLHAAMLEARADAAERTRDRAEADAEAWRAMAEKLAARRRWWLFR